MCGIDYIFDERWLNLSSKIAIVAAYFEYFRVLALIIQSLCYVSALVLKVWNFPKITVYTSKIFENSTNPYVTHF